MASTSSKIALVHEQAARGRAALAGGADGAEHNRRDRQLQVGAVVDDDRVVAAELEQRTAHAARDALADHAADLGRAGEADQRDALVVDEVLRQLGAGIVEQEEDVRETAALSAALQIFIEAIADSGVFGDGFQSVMSPQMAAMKLFQAHTATGKLKAEITPTMPIGCHCSYMRWPGRSECMVRP